MENVHIASLRDVNGFLLWDEYRRRRKKLMELIDENFSIFHFYHRIMLILFYLFGVIPNFIKINVGKIFEG